MTGQAQTRRHAPSGTDPGTTCCDTGDLERDSRPVFAIASIGVSSVILLDRAPTNNYYIHLRILKSPLQLGAYYFNGATKIMLSGAL